MLPAVLSSDLCSLHGGVDRLAVSVIWTLSSNLKEVKSTWYGRTVIHNCAAMTYDQADRILQDLPPEESNQPLPPPLTAGAPVDLSLIVKLKQDLSILTSLARKLRGDREELGGAVDLSSGDTGSELKFTLVDGKPVQVTAKQDKEIHHTIAEMMIMANTFVAKKIHERFPESALLRIHRSAEEDRFEDLQEVLKASGISFDGSSNMALAASLKEAQKKSRSKAANSLFLSLATRAMTEAQYICTGDRKVGDSLSHYGLGLEHYTHFTSPIRRYADVVVHKQLLASLKPAPEQMKAAIDPVAIPDSNVVSILAGEGLDEHEDEEDNLIDALTGDASELVLGTEAPSVVVSETSVDEKAGMSGRPYETTEVSSICEGLNLHNRLAKQVSYECQGLFLSLYFKQHVEKTLAVVTNLRENGLWVYVPKFDMRGPVYLRDTNDDVQIDPAFVGLSPDSGLPPTLGFSESTARRFPQGKCELCDEHDERLEVTVAESAKSFVVRPLDVVTVELKCDNWDVRARVPSPRLQLVPSKSKGILAKKSPPDYVEIKSDELTQKASLLAPAENQVDRSATDSMFDVLTGLTIRPVLKEVPLRSALPRSQKAKPDRTETMKGRLIYGGFTNPDTRSAAQEALQQTAAAEAAQRRAAVMEAASRRNEYDAVRRIERDVTSRQQRLAADKRHTRKSKAK
jgi:hypothetical protein